MTISSDKSPQLPLNCQQLVTIFDRCFARAERTCLVGGAAEPLYRPAQTKQALHRIEFSHDYFASALHEVAHWCVAGPERRLQEDYGYWYAPDGRTREQQGEFEHVEAKPQALEWLFSVAAGAPFRVSADNLAQGLGPSDTFKDAVHTEVVRLCQDGVNQRVARFCQALLAYYRPNTSLASLLSAYRFARSSL